LALSLIRAVTAKGIYHRVLIGTDTPGGTGVIPRGILREIAFISSVGEVPPEKTICMATGNVGRAHGLDIGILEEGRPADVVLMHKITGSVARDALDSFSKGDLPGISYVIIDGEIRVAGRSQTKRRRLSGSPMKRAAEGGIGDCLEFWCGLFPTEPLRR